MMKITIVDCLRGTSQCPQSLSTKNQIPLFRRAQRFHGCTCFKYLSGLPDTKTSEKLNSLVAPERGIETEILATVGCKLCSSSVKFWFHCIQRLPLKKASLYVERQMDLLKTALWKQSVILPRYLAPPLLVPFGCWGVLLLFRALDLWKSFAYLNNLCLHCEFHDSTVPDGHGLRDFNLPSRYKIALDSSQLNILSRSKASRLSTWVNVL